ncbi:MAG TPA: hypothetical protein VNK95_11465, partial [Caldilineaceae bacterium]|nr:hypothetical protein [Caldilineaceae bacterium]
HNMEELAALCHRLYVIAEGRTALAGTPAEVFAQSATLRALRLDAPAATTVVERLVEEGLLAPSASAYTVDQAEALLVARLEGARV